MPGHIWESATRESYDRVARAYAQATESAVGAPGPMTDAFIRFASLFEHWQGRVLDAGCGPGGWTQWMHTRGLEVVGVDISPRMVTDAQRSHPSSHFAAASLTRLPFADAAFVGTACWYVLHHVPDDAIEQVLSELIRVTEPGGALLIGGHVGSGRRTKREGYGGIDMNVLIQRRPSEYWCDSLRRHGCTVVHHHVFDGQSPWHVLLTRC